MTDTGKLTYLYSSSRWLGLTRERITKETEKSVMIGSVRVPKDKLEKGNAYVGENWYYLPTPELDNEYKTVAKRRAVANFINRLNPNNVDSQYPELFELVFEIIKKENKDGK